jgi:hypothetical protein
MTTCAVDEELDASTSLRQIRISASFPQSDEHGCELRFAADYLKNIAHYDGSTGYTFAQLLAQFNVNVDYNGLTYSQTEDKVCVSAAVVVVRKRAARFPWFWVLVHSLLLFTLVPRVVSAQLILRVFWPGRDSSMLWHFFCTYRNMCSRLLLTVRCRTPHAALRGEQGKADLGGPRHTPQLQPGWSKAGSLRCVCRECLPFMQTGHEIAESVVSSCAHGIHSRFRKPGAEPLRDQKVKRSVVLALAEQFQVRIGYLLNFLTAI